MTRPRHLGGIVLLAHGSPDPAWRRPVEAVCRTLRREHGVQAATAYLGHGPPTPEDAVERLAAAGCTDIEIVACFLSSGGGHVRRDLPALVERLSRTHPKLSIRLRPGALGEDPDVVAAMARAAARPFAEDGQNERATITRN